MLAFDAYLRSRAWLAWNTGLVAAGAITEFNVLLPDAAGVEAEGVGIQSDVQMAHNMAMWRRIFGLKAERVDLGAGA